MFRPGVNADMSETRMNVQISECVVAWLASMGYPVLGMPAALLRGMLVHEARKWQISPLALVTMIREDAPASHAERSATRRSAPYAGRQGARRVAA
jgi:hypothetical protein